MEWAHQRDRLIDFDARTAKRWEQLYEELGWTDTDALGAILHRGAPQIRRLALVYAVADRAPKVTGAHVSAAVEVWRYSHESVEYIWRDDATATPSDPVEDGIDKVLASQSGEWVPLTVFTQAAAKRKIQAYRVRAALDKRVAAGRLEHQEVRTGGRPRSEWRVLS